MSHPYKLNARNSYTLILLALAFASTLGQLSHYSFGHFFLYLAFLFLLLAIAFVITEVLARRRNKNTLPREPLTQNSLSQWEWSDYRQDVFYKIIWRWKYRLDLDDSPRDITPYCPDCDKKLSDYHTKFWNKNLYFECRSCGRWFLRIPHYEQTVTDCIQEKIKDGSWKEVVKRQRLFGKG